MYMHFLSMSMVCEILNSWPSTREFKYFFMPCMAGNNFYVCMVKTHMSCNIYEVLQNTKLIKIWNYQHFLYKSYGNKWPKKCST